VSEFIISEAGKPPRHKLGSFSALIRGNEKMNSKKMAGILSGALISALVAGSSAFAEEHATAPAAGAPAAETHKDSCGGPNGCQGMESDKHEEHEAKVKKTSHKASKKTSSKKEAKKVESTAPTSEAAAPAQHE
jgi:hypothetical protein